MLAISADDATEQVNQASARSDQLSTPECWLTLMRSGAVEYD